MNKQPALQKTLAERILQRLDFIKLQAECVLDLGINNSCMQEGLSKKYPQAKINTLEPLKINLPDASVDLVVSNLAINEDLEHVLQLVMRVLKPEGVFMFTQLGVDSLKEMKKEGVQFPDMHDIGDVLLKLGFKDPVMDMENIMFTYDETSKIMPDMQDTGFEYLLGKHQGATLENGLYPLTFEIIYGLAYKPTKAKQHSHDGEVRVSIDEITKRN